MEDLGIHRFKTRYNCAKLAKDLQEYVNNGNEDGYYSTVRTVAKDDFFCFCYFCLGLPVNHPFLIARIYEIQAQSHMTIDLWFREGWKSTLNTLAMPLWELAKNPMERIAIFSHTRTMAKKHLTALKMTMETNNVLKYAFPDVFFEKPEKQAPKWSLDDGLYVKRERVFKESSIEAWGLVDGLPTGSHFTVRVYDDIVDAKSVNTSEQIEKASEAFKNSQNLGARVKRWDAEKNKDVILNAGKMRVIGTRYSMRDSYDEMIKNKRYKVRLYPAEVDDEGVFKRMGHPVLINRDALEEKYDLMGDYVYSAQMGQNPVSEKQQKFKSYWIQYYKRDTLPYLNKYILVDPAMGKKADSDYTVMCVIGVSAGKNFYLVDMIRDRLGLLEKWKKLRDLVALHEPLFVGYEKYGMQADLEFYNMQMEEEGCHFSIEPVGGVIAKSDRIKALVPLFQKHRFIIPRSLPYIDIDGDFKELTDEFLKEYQDYPYGHDDMLDCMSRILDKDVPVTFPTRKNSDEEKLFKPDPLNMREQKQEGSWMAN